jgi:2'-5' RNA ligase
MTMYSVWLEPPPETIGARTQKFIADVASRVPSAPMFAPHVTLLGGFTFDSDEAACVAFDAVLVREKERRAEGAEAPLRCSTSAIVCGDRRHQCVYVKLEKTQALVAAFETANAVIALPGASSDTFMPHMSLAYGIDDEGVRDGVRADAEATLLGDDPRALDFDVASYSLWKTDIEDDSCDSWVRLASSSFRNVLEM